MRTRGRNRSLDEEWSNESERLPSGMQLKPGMDSGSAGVCGLQSAAEPTDGRQTPQHGQLLHIGEVRRLWDS
jgi:hypothetical protein